jgi:ribosomal protein S27AE
LLLCDAHRECPDCGSESLAAFHEDQEYGDPNGGG